MPIYEYRCGACGCEDEVMQKISDAPLTDCPECGAAEYTKLVSAAGFRLKGSGWYETDFKTRPKKDADKPAASDAAPACGAGACPACAD